MPETPPPSPAWADWPDEKLLDLRFKDLDLRIEGTYLETCVKRLHEELDKRGLLLKPVCYLGDEWFSPDGVPAIAIPFYLAHPRLMKLEESQMLEIEGGEGDDVETETLKYLRHECGHALVHGYRLTRLRDWRKIFGNPTLEFRDYYRFQPYSRNYVRHLENWYAQSHPEEDFAETFAVWLNPDNDWRTQYRGWPALKKLQYVDSLMGRLAGRPPSVTHIQKPFHIRVSSKRLRRHYEQRRKLYAEDDPAFFDQDLHRLFVARGDPEAREPASRFLRRWRRNLLYAVSYWTRERRFTVNRLLKRITARCDELKLYVAGDETRTQMELAAYLSSLVSHYLFTGSFQRTR